MKKFLVWVGYASIAYSIVGYAVIWITGCY